MRAGDKLVTDELAEGCELSRSAACRDFPAPSRVASMRARASSVTVMTVEMRRAYNSSSGIRLSRFGVLPCALGSSANFLERRVRSEEHTSELQSPYDLV